MILTASALCLALNVYHEARGEPVQGQVAVAFVTLNRVHQQDSTVCKVVFEHKQFSWTNERFVLKKVKHGKKCSTIKVANPEWDKRYLHVKHNRAWEQAVYVAEYALRHNKNDITKGCTLYHATYVNPYWRTAYQQVMQIGQHIFYKKA